MLNTSLYVLFLLIAVPTVLSPGPGVLMSLTNSIRLGVRRATPGIIGVALGTLVVALVSSTGLGMLLATSEKAYAAVKLMGIGYLFYLGWKKFRDKPYVFNLAGSMQPTDEQKKYGIGRLFVEGVILQITNPALLVFYISLFPQCIDPNLPFWPQFVLLSVNYVILVYVIHTGYGILGSSAAKQFLKPSSAVWLNRISGFCFWLIGGSLVWTMIWG